MSMSDLQAGVMGWPVEHSLSPRLHSFWLKKYGIAGSYVPLAVKPEKLCDELKNLARQKFRGVNLTVPHKEAALSIVDYLDPVAKHVGAVNTITVREDGILEGHNTDVYGFEQNLIAGNAGVRNKSAVILGAGGAARAAIVALQQMGSHDIRVVNRTFDKAQSLAQEFSAMEQSHFLPKGESVEEAASHILRVSAHHWGDTKALANAALLVNATSLGLKGQPPLEIDLSALPKDAVVTDMVYSPLMTGLLQQAEKRGHQIVDGLGMLLYQARPAFKAFFGVDPEVDGELRGYVLEGLK